MASIVGAMDLFRTTVELLVKAIYLRVLAVCLCGLGSLGWPLPIRFYIE